MDKERYICGGLSSSILFRLEILGALLMFVNVTTEGFLFGFL